jgi:predicted HNH restriction endonuclease
LRYRIALIKYKGSKCENCGYEGNEGNISVMEFHHTDPNQKEFGIGDGIKSWESMKKEVDKCILLCSNCHRIKHSEKYWNNMYEQAKIYYGGNQELRNLLAG